MSRALDRSPEVPDSAMRLDVFLKKSRMIPRRTLAHDACSHGVICVNGRIAKGSRLVRVGDLIQWRGPGRVTSVRVARIPAVNLSKKEASSLYEVVKKEFVPVENQEVCAETDSS